MLFCLALGLTASGTGLASSADADAAFLRGTRAYQQGNNHAAALAFEEAYRLSPHGVAKYSAALAWEADKELARAADDYRIALDSGQLDEHQRADAEKRLERLERGLGRIQVTAPAGTTIHLAHIDAAKTPINVHVAPGTHQIVAHFADGRQSSTEVHVGAGETFDAALKAPETASVETPPAPAKEKPKPLEPPSSTGSAQRTVGFVVLGGGVVASLAAVYLGTRALKARDDFYASNFYDQDSHDRAASLKTATNITWGVAGVLGAAGAVLIFTAPSSKEHPQQAVSLALSPVGATLAGGF
jgi:tetratricopeptide (TPR) repeat protein